MVTSLLGARAGSDASRGPREWAGRLRLSLFPEAQPRPVSWRQVVTAGTAVLLGTVVSLARTRGPGAFNTLWAEDGNHFLNDALNMRTMPTLVKGLNGYFVLLPRLIAEPASVLPLTWAPAVMSISAALVTSLFAVGVYLASGAHLSNPLLRLLVSVPIVTTPVGALTTPNNVATLQFAALYATFWMLIWVPSRRTGRIFALSIVVLTGLSTILILTLLPLAVARLLLRRERWSAVLAVTVFAVTMTQVVALAVGLTSREGLSHPRLDPLWAVVEYVLWALPYSILGERWLAPPVNGFNEFWGTSAPAQHLVEHAALVAVAYLLAIGVIVLAVRRMTRPAWGLAALAATHSVGIFAVEVMGMGYEGSRTYLVPEILLLRTERYLVPVALLVATAITALLRPDAEPQDRDPEPARGWVPAPNAWPVVAYATLAIIVCVANLRVDNPRSRTVPWSDVVATAKAECAATGARTVRGRYGGEVWYPWVNIPCRKL